jgi:hypothetical protein
LVVYSYEHRRMEATFKGGQDSCRIIELMMMMMIFVFVVTLHPHAAATFAKYARTFILFIQHLTQPEPLRSPDRSGVLHAVKLFSPLSP